ncbi:hypothetical protein [Streptomyces sp. NBC_00304]|uniref:hypothetical protein n=1 Tax=Streptomyces sp. NBC_00304 TaxID=2975706 RepID=UPI002E28AB38|nr:hypothetical protein [Streptomyces sp. NBC_00304]
MRASQRDADTNSVFEPLRAGARHLLVTAETQLAHLSTGAVQPRWIYQLGVLNAALEQLEELQQRWTKTLDTLPNTQPGNPDFDDALAEHHAESWSYLDDWAAHGQAITEINSAARKAPSSLAPAPAPATGPDRRPASRR